MRRPIETAPFLGRNLGFRQSSANRATINHASFAIPGNHSGAQNGIPLLRSCCWLAGGLFRSWPNPGGLKLKARKKSVPRLKAELKSLSNALAKLRKRRQAFIHDNERTETKIIQVRHPKLPQADKTDSNAVRKLFEELWKLDKSIIEVRYRRLKIWRILAHRKARRTK